jgi:hypothetical protein
MAWKVTWPSNTHGENGSPDGKRIAMGTGSFDFQVWDADSGHHLQTYSTSDEEISTLAWSPDGTRLAEAGLSHTISIYAPLATFIGQASLYDLTLVGVFATSFVLLVLLLGPDGEMATGEDRERVAVDPARLRADFCAHGFDDHHRAQSAVLGLECLTTISGTRAEDWGKCSRRGLLC